MFCAYGDEQPVLEDESTIKNKPRWPTLGLGGGVDFEMDGNELQIQFGVQHGIIEPYQNLHAKGGRSVDSGELKVVGEIATW